MSNDKDSESTTPLRAGWGFKPYRNRRNPGQATEVSAVEGPTVEGMLPEISAMATPGALLPQVSSEEVPDVAFSLGANNSEAPAADFIARVRAEHPELDLQSDPDEVSVEEGNLVEEVVDEFELQTPAGSDQGQKPDQGQKSGPIVELDGDDDSYTVTMSTPKTQSLAAETLAWPTTAEPEVVSAGPEVAASVPAFGGMPSRRSKGYDPLVEEVDRKPEITAKTTDPAPVDRDRLSDEVDKLKLINRRGTSDLGLLVLRVAIGTIFILHGFQKFFGWWNGPKISGFTEFLTNSADLQLGWGHPHLMAVITATTETVGGFLLVFGLATPIAASALASTMVIATLYQWTLAGSFNFFAQGGGVEYELVLIGALVAIVLAGPGKIAVDYAGGWSRRPYLGSVAILVGAIGTAFLIWVLFNGNNPLK